jgi:hypothetical protein
MIQAHIASDAIAKAVQRDLQAEVDEVTITPIPPVKPKTDAVEKPGRPSVNKTTHVGRSD